jgi:hypothetical protein
VIVAIKDRATLLRMHPARVGAYLNSRGWKRAFHEPTRYSLWVKVRQEPIEILLPLNPRLGDFAERMAELLGDLQRDEERSQLEILRDIEIANCDIFRFRKEPHSSFLGTMPIEDGVRFVSCARDFLLYAASAEHDPLRQTVAGRRAEDVARFMSQALLGQTEISSFVVTAQVPVEPQLTDELFPEAITPSSEPFERRAGVRLMNVLSRTREAALEAAQTGDARPFTEALKMGATVNLYSALLEAQEIASSEALEVHCSWAPVRPLVGPVPADVVIFEPEIMQSVKAAVSLLRPRSPREGEHLFGLVELLHQAAQEKFIGDLAIEAKVEGRVRKVHLSLQQPEYGQAIKAFSDKRPIEVTGDLVKVGKHWELHNPRELFVYAPDDEEGALSDEG